MNYYKRHIGDYAKKAGHLSILEHGVYTLLMDAYYDREQAPTKQEAVRISRARTPDELAALDAVLADFFTETDGRYVQTRIEEEFTKAEAQAMANQANGKHGGRPRKPKGETKKAKENQTKTHSVSDENQNDNEKNPNPSIHQSTNPTTEKQKNSSPSGSRLAPDWSLPADWKTWAEQERPELDVLTQAASFSDYWHGVAGAKGRKADWLATWRNWIRNSNAGSRPRAGPAFPPQKSKALMAIEKLQGMKNGLAENGNRNWVTEANHAWLGVGATDGLNAGNASGMDGSIDP